MKFKLNFNFMCLRKRSLMKTISLLEFRKNSKKILEWARRGERMVMTFRGVPVCRIEPMGNKLPDTNDSFYQITDLADEKGGALKTQEMDKIIYGL